MAHITRRPFISHLRSNATSHVVHMKRGKIKRSGTGLAFWFRPLTAALSEVPVDNRDMSLFFHCRTADFQDVSVQATVSYRIANPELTAQQHTVESERTISQNELQSRIELATREKELLTQEGENLRKRAEDEAAARAIADDAAAKAERMLGDARAASAKALVDAHKGADASVLLARAAQTAASNLQSVESLTITPDLLSKFLGSKTGE